MVAIVVFPSNTAFAPPRITLFEPPHRFHYVLFAGTPGLLQHEGRLIVSAQPSGLSSFRWEVDFLFRSAHWFRPFVPSFASEFEGVLADGLAELARQLRPA